MTLQDLKDNRAVIIETITDMVGVEKVKEVMTLMAGTIGWNGIRSKNAIAYVKEIIELNDIKPYVAPNTLWGAGCKYSTQSEYQRACLGKKFN